MAASLLHPWASSVINGPFDMERNYHQRGAFDHHTRISIASPSRPWTSDSLPPDVFRSCDASRQDFYHKNMDATCQCNASHAVTYTFRPDAEADVAVHVVWTSDDLPKKAPQRTQKSNFLLYLEPPHNLQMHSAPGFDGVVGFRRPVGAEPAVWHPWCSHEQMWEYVARWQLDATRNDVGVWIRNCMGYNRLWRTSVIDGLFASGVTVASYGDCRRTVPADLRVTALNQGSVDRLPDGKPGYCRRHRVMLAVENNACRDWISDNFCQAIQCGAIPIIKSVWHHGALLPDYAAIYGDEIAQLVVNASAPGWLADVKRLMLDDEFYAARIGAWKRAAAAHLSAVRPRADPGNYHCQWWDAVGTVRGARSAPRDGDDATPRWQTCACPAGNRGEFDDEARSRAELKHRWLPTCSTPSE